VAAADLAGAGASEEAAAADDASSAGAGDDSGDSAADSGDAAAAATAGGSMIATGLAADSWPQPANCGSKHNSVAPDKALARL